MTAICKQTPAKSFRCVPYGIASTLLLTKECFMYGFFVLLWSLVQSIGGCFTYAFFITGGIHENGGVLTLVAIIIMNIIGGLLDKAIRGVDDNPLAEIIFTALIAPIRFPVQLLVNIVLFCKQDSLERGFVGPDKWEFLALLWFLLTSCEIEGKSSSSSSYSRSSYSSTSRNRSSAPAYKETVKSVYGESDVYRAMKNIALYADEANFRTIYNSVSIRFTVRCDIINKKIRFKFNYEVDGADGLRSADDMERAKQAISYAVNNKATRTFDKASAWFDSHPVDSDYELSQPEVSGRMV